MTSLIWYIWYGHAVNITVSEHFLAIVTLHNIKRCDIHFFTINHGKPRFFFKELFIFQKYHHLSNEKCWDLTKFIANKLHMPSFHGPGTTLEQGLLTYSLTYKCFVVWVQYQLIWLSICQVTIFKKPCPNFSILQTVQDKLCFQAYILLLWLASNYICRRKYSENMLFEIL